MLTIFLSPIYQGGLPGRLSGKELTCRHGRHGFGPWVRKTPWRTIMATQERKSSVCNEKGGFYRLGGCFYYFSPGTKDSIIVCYLTSWHLELRTVILRSSSIRSVNIYTHLLRVGLVVKNPPANAGDVRDMGSVSGLRRPPGGGHGNPLQYSCLENPMDRRA